MFPVAIAAAGTATAAPDPCLTPAPPGPPVPMAYSNQAMLMQANPGTCTKKVKVMGKAVLLKMSIIPQSMQNEPGAAGGVMSGMNMGPAMPKMASLFVKAEGAAVLHQTCMIGQNGMSMNALGVQDTPCQTMVKVGA